MYIIIKNWKQPKHPRGDWVNKLCSQLSIFWRISNNMGKCYNVVLSLWSTLWNSMISFKKNKEFTEKDYKVIDQNCNSRYLWLMCDCYGWHLRYSLAFHIFSEFPTMNMHNSFLLGKKMLFKNCFYARRWSTVQNHSWLLCIS